MEKKLNKALNELIFVIKNSDDYKKCVEIKEKLAKNNDVCRLVQKIKKDQKEYVRNNDLKIKEKLDQEIIELEQIPIYKEYMKHLDKINEMIYIVKEKLNNYFDKLVN